MSLSKTTLSLSICSILSTQIFAANQPSTEADLRQLNTITLKAKAAPNVGTSQYTEEDLKNTPNSSKSITDFLKINPNVQFSNDHLAASTQANLNPSEISIHGAQTFQNKFVINGVSNTNILDPLGTGSNTGEYSIKDAGSQGIAINTDLLCNLEVLDSNVSAKHGSFTGGVISADTCAPKSKIGEVHGNISYDYTSSDWVKYHQRTDADKGLFEGQSTQSNQKEYTRQGMSANLYTKLSETYGLNVFASQRQSEIPVETGYLTPQTINQKKVNTNFGATFFADPDTNSSYKFGFSLGDLEDNTYASKRLNSQSTQVNDSLLAFIESNKQYDWAKIKQRLNYQSINNSRTSPSNSGINWLHSEGSKNWANTEKVWEGATSADIELSQENISYHLDAEFKPFQLAQTQHRINAGFGYQYDDVQWERTQDFSTFYGSATGSQQALFDLKGQSCASNDPYCDESPTSALSKQNFNGQYFTKGNLYKAGDFDASYNQISAYIEDTMQWQNLTARVGVRADYDESNNNLNFAPRTNFSYKPFANETLKLTTGWNRYYTAPTYITDLQRSITAYDYTLSRKDQHTKWSEAAKFSANSTRKSDLKTPYTDEWVLGMSSQYKNTNMALKWVNRQYEDEISRDYTTVRENNFIYSYEYGNKGYAESDTVTLELGTVSPLRFGGTSHDLNLAINYSDTYRGTPDYTEAYKEADILELISYNGKIIQYGDRPADNFNKPVTARVSWDIGFSNLPLHVTNFIRYQDSYDRTVTSANKVVYEGAKLDTYTVESIKPAFSWDIRSTYELKLNKNYSTLFGLTINNLTDRNNHYVSGSKHYSEVGRQFIADVTLKF